MPTAKTPLQRCPSWPTMQWVPKAVTNRLDVQVKVIRDAGYSAFRKDVLGLIVIYRAPETAEELWSLLEEYMLATAPAMRGRSGNKALSPVSMRIDAFVEAVRELGYSAYRHELVGALILKRQPDTDRELISLYKNYRAARAEAVRLPGVPMRRLLTSERPLQGRRRAVI